MAAAVFVGARRDLHAGPARRRRVRGRRARACRAARRGFADEIAIGRYGTRPRHRHDGRAARDAARPAAPAATTTRATRPPTSCISAAPPTTATRAGAGSTATSPSCAPIVERDGAAIRIGEDARRDGRRRRWPGSDPAGDRGDRDPGVGAGRDRSAARVRAAGRRKLGAAGALRVLPRWSGEAALRVGARRRRHVHHAVARPLRRVLAPAAERRAPAPTRARGSTRRAARLPARLPRTLARRGWRTWPPTPRRPPATPARRDDADRGRRRARCAPSTATRSSRARRPAGVDPVESFLLGEPPGHCELFASAAVLLLRAARRSRPLRDRLPGRRMERRRRLRRRPRRPRPRLGGGVRARTRLGARRRDAAGRAAAARRPLVRSRWTRSTTSGTAGSSATTWGASCELARRAGRHLAPPRRARVARAHLRDRRRLRACWRRCCWPRVACGAGARARCATRTT